MKNQFTLLFGMILFISVPYSENSFACSSCGTGGDDPLLLYPGEQTKVYLGATSQSGIRNVLADGSETVSFSTERRQRLVFALGQRVTPRGFVTLAMPYVTNTRRDRSQSGLGDPTIGGRWTLIRQNFATPMVPQVQVLASYKPSFSRSVEEAKDPEFLDVYGSGYHDLRMGLDLWSAMTSWRYGTGFLVSQSLSKTIDGETRQPGTDVSGTLTCGYGWDWGQLITGVVGQYTSPTELDGKELEGSSIRQNALFATAYLKATDNDTVRLTYRRNGAFGYNFNTTRFHQVTLDYARQI